MPNRLPSDQTTPGVVAREDDRLIGALEARLAPFHLAWRQELVITLSNRDRLAFVASELWAEREENEPESLPAPQGLLPFTVERARGRMHGGSAGSLKLRAVALLAALGALVSFLLAALRLGAWSRLYGQDASTVVALHAEDANRTKHVRKALADCDPDSTDVLFVGRPHLSPEEVRKMLAKAGWNGGFALAWDRRAALGGLREGWRIMREAAPAMLAAGYNPGFAQLVAIGQRIFIGTASAWRWRQEERRAKTVVFGHVGRADTVLPEAAMRAGGAKTVHWMHGLSDGRAFQGVSDASVVLCESDARWHDRIAHYGTNRAFPLAPAPFRMGTSREWMVLTNLTHFAYPPFAQVGPAHELALIDMVAELARAEGPPPAQVIWKPHPVFYTTDPATREIVTQALGRAGFQLWPLPATDFERAEACEVLIATPSGIAIDLLARGRLPLMAELAPQEPDHALAHFQPRCATVEELQHGFALVRDPQLAGAEFARLTAAIGPGRHPGIAEIERIFD